MLISIAVDFRHANVATRERFHLSPERIVRLHTTALPANVRELVAIASTASSKAAVLAGSCPPVQA